MRVHIYCLLDPETGVPRYVGLTRNVKRRVNQYSDKAHTLHLNNWLRKMKKISCGPTLRVICSVDESVADIWERRWIRRFRDRGYKLINYTNGGERSYTTTQEYKDKISAVMKKRWKEDYERMASISRSNLELSRGIPVDRSKSGERLKRLNALRKGIPLTEEHKAKVSASLKGKKKSEHVKDLQRELRKKNWQDPVYRARMLESMAKTQFKKGDVETARRGGLASAAKKYGDGRVVMSES